MEKILMSALIVLLTVIFILMLISGISIGTHRISSIQDIISENENLDSSISNLNTTIEQEYKSAKSNLDASFKKLQVSKKNYQDQIIYSTEEEIKAANQDEQYQIGYLWTKIGLYSSRNNVTIQANVTAGNIQGKYNISFTVTGEYINISEFIRAIEADSNLGFRIEDFTLLPDSNEADSNEADSDKNKSDGSLKATFVIRNISIDEATLMSTSSITSENTDNTN